MVGRIYWPDQLELNEKQRKENMEKIQELKDQLEKLNAAKTKLVQVHNDFLTLGNYSFVQQPAYNPAANMQNMNSLTTQSGNRINDLIGELQKQIKDIVYDIYVLENRPELSHKDVSKFWKDDGKNV